MEGKIYFTSDLHFGHQKDFLYKPRGFNSLEKMEDYIVEKWNNKVTNNDDVYVLGDLMLMDDDHGLNLIKKLNGKLHIIFGNHDTDNRIIKYCGLDNIVEVCFAQRIRYKKYNFYLSHYPTITTNIDDRGLQKILINLHGHTHSKEKFYNGIATIYNVSMDAHNCEPIEVEKILDDIRKEFSKNNFSKENSDES